MPFIDWIPVVSQLKATVQLVTGDADGGFRTQENFLRECPGVSQLTSIVQLATGHTEAAIETQKCCIGTINNVVNCVPVIGHVKGVLHHAVGDHKGGNQALNAATRSTVVATSGVAARIISGGIGAIPAAIAAGAIYDVAASSISREAQGIVAAFINAVDNPSAGGIFDLVAIPVGDGLAGYSGGKIGDEMKPKISASMKIISTAKNWSDLLNRKTSRNAVIQVASEISTLPYKINSIEYGTLKYETDGKARQVADKNNRRPRETTNYYFPAWDEEVISFVEEDPLYYDSHVEAIVAKNNSRRKRKDKKKKTGKEKAKQKKLKTLEGLYERQAQVPLRNDTTTLDILSELLRRFKQDPNRDPSQNPKLKKVVLQLLSRSRLSLIMPEEFPYTVVNQLNDDRHGVYHSFIRHINQWREVISFDNTLIRRISPLKTEITNLTGAVENPETVKARIEFEEARSQLERPEPYYGTLAKFRFLYNILDVKGVDSFLGLQGCGLDCSFPCVTRNFFCFPMLSSIFGREDASNPSLDPGG
ncbi:uncharacterized protein LOC143211397 isoform X2 [Lasioglossum baleicum]|uniref:uncharacterized protein LOC143211397 isoform X2 n=1 Tax=Lasioglossum baleicum TaxID=434251 RepID=UPI003FCD7085